MVNKTTIISVLAVIGMALVLVNAASVGDLRYTKRSDNNTEMTIEEATKTCNQSFVIKMGNSKSPTETSE